MRRAYIGAVAGNEMVVLLTDAKATAESTAQLAVKLGETGSLNKLDQAREQVFYAEVTADLATLRQDAASSRERLIRLLGLWGNELNIDVRRVARGSLRRSARREKEKRDRERSARHGPIPHPCGSTDRTRSMTRRRGRE